LPLIAILRGIGPDQALAVGRIIVGAGFRILEVPISSPGSLESIRNLSREYGENQLIGAGTISSTAMVRDVAAAGGRLIIMPHVDTAVIAAAKEAGLFCIPGVATPTEALLALDAGADALKVFPAEQIAPPVLRAWRAVLPKEAILLPVGGLTADSMRLYWHAGAAGFGIGTALYTPNKTFEDIELSAKMFNMAWFALTMETAG
jgi:2-dehydro-3-deoxyphosphogalactonate aldolase